MSKNKTPSFQYNLQEIMEACEAIRKHHPHAKFVIKYDNYCYIIAEIVLEKK